LSFADEQLKNMTVALEGFELEANKLFSDARSSLEQLGGPPKPRRAASLAEANEKAGRRKLRAALEFAANL
jgi:hypothetical protein